MALTGSIVDAGNSISRVGDIAVAGAAQLAWTSAVANLADNPVELVTVAAEVAKLAYLGIVADSLLRDSAAPAYYAGGDALTNRNVLVLSTATNSPLGPLKLDGATFARVGNQPLNSPVAGAITSGEATTITLTDSLDNNIVTISGRADEVMYGLLHAFHSLAENTTSMLHSIRSQILRSNVPSPFDQLTESRLNTLLSGPVQENLKRWGFSQAYYATWAISGNSLQNGVALGHAVSNAILNVLSPSIAAAYEDGVSAFKAASI